MNSPCAVMLVYQVTIIAHLSVVSSGLESLKGSFTPVGSTAVCERSSSYLRAIGVLSVFSSVSTVIVWSRGAWGVIFVQLLTCVASLDPS